MVLAAVLLGAALVTWIVTVERMDGMDAGPGTDLGGLGWYVGIWVTMMAAMMLPSVAPMAIVFTRVARSRAERGRAYVSPWIFVSGYLVAWTLYGLLAYGIFRAIKAADWGFLAWDAQGPIVAGAAIAVAGLYQLTPLKARLSAALPWAAPLHPARLARRPGRRAAHGGRARRCSAWAAAGG